MIAAKTRAAIILQVRSGQLTATQAAQELGISRQRYYQWEKRALQAMLHALQDKPKGRPPQAKRDPQKTQLQKRVTHLENELREHEEREKLRAAIKKLESRLGRDSAKKNAK